MFLSKQIVETVRAVSAASEMAQREEVWGRWVGGRAGGCHFSGVLCEAILARMPWSQLCTARTGKCLLATWLRSSGQYLEPIFDTYDAEHTALKVNPSLNVLLSAAPPQCSVKHATGGTGRWWVGGFSRETCESWTLMSFLTLIRSICQKKSG